MTKIVWLIGTSHIADKYLEVLNSLNVSVIVIGRSESSAKDFSLRTGVQAFVGGLESFLSTCPARPDAAINAVDVTSLASITEKLIRFGIKDILVEKPGSTSLSESIEIRDIAVQHGANIAIAFNRRFFESVIAVKEIIKNDNGAKYCRFDFTENADEIEKLSTPLEIKKKWLYANSTHVIDTVFHLIGPPKHGEFSVSGANEISWHPVGSVFRGYGESTSGSQFSYHSDWRVPGRWGIEIGTHNFKISLCPMEELQILKRGTFNWQKVSLDVCQGREFKHGFFKQIKSFLEHDFDTLCLIDEHVTNFEYFNKISGYDS